jgi:alpha-tubulin suppressor-like RCC1 family protein
MVAGLTIFSSGAPAQATGPNPTVSALATKPSALAWTGGTVKLSATVTHASECTFSATQSIPGLPATVACSSGKVKDPVTVPANDGIQKIKFKLSVLGTNGSKVNAKANVTVQGVGSVASSHGSYCAVLPPGNVDCWGYNHYGELGNGTVDGPDGEDGYDTAQPVAGITSALHVIGDNDNSFCALLSSGAIDCWGNNEAGQLGNGTIDGPDGENGYDTPQAVSGVSNAVSLSSDDSDAYCAVLSGGGVDCWGYNGFGDLGNGAEGGPDGNYGYDTPQAVTGVTTAVAVVGQGLVSFCALLSTGKVDCWGDNTEAQLGNGNLFGPDNEVGGGAGFSGYDTPQAVSGLTNAVSVIADESDGYCALLSTSRVDCWGGNLYGEVGNGTNGGPDNSGYDTPQAVSGITNAVSLTSDNLRTNCALLSTGAVDCWGFNNDGELGNGTTGGFNGADGYDTPQAVTGITDATALAAGFTSDAFCAVLSTTGAVDCWGYNFYGELGNAAVGGPDGANGYDTPQAVSGLSAAATVIGGSDANSCVLLTNQSVDCWGYNGLGDLGDGTVNGPDGEKGYDTPQAVS